MARLDELGRRIADAADPSIGAVFAGWRAQPQPDDVNARVALTMHVLREMRGGAHIIAVNACGITPLDAVLASPAPAAAQRAGVGRASRLDGPFADPDGKPRGAGRSRTCDIEDHRADLRLDRRLGAR